MRGAGDTQKRSKTARCCVKRITGQRETGEWGQRTGGNRGNKKRIPKFDRTMDKFKKV